jgi:pimeloyl-ACP methyl ester carboxylesterase
MHRSSILHRVSRTSTRLDERDDTGHGHIGLVVSLSIVLGLVLGLALDLVVLGGGPETTITGAALLSFAAGCATLAVLSTRRTDQPQRWARVPAASFGVTGAAILIFDPGDATLGRLDWLWPALLLALVVWMLRASRGQLRNWSRRALLYPAFALVALVAAGGAFETVAETAGNAPHAGRTYLVAGHRLYLRCEGSGAPTVVLFNGLSERTPSWTWVRRDVAAQTRVCVFDRAGQGWSGSFSGRQDAHQLSADAHGLLAAAHVPGPYVLAGHSVGGAYALAYAMDYPNQVAGVALIDSASPDQFDLPAYPGFYSIWNRVSALLPSLARAGIVRLALGTGFDSLPRADRGALRAFGSSPRELRADRNEFASLPTVFRQDRALTSLGGKPLFVLTAERGEQPGWSALQRKLTTLSSNSLHETAHGATHAALLEDRGFAAATGRAIRAVVRSARNGDPIAPQGRRLT